MTCALSIGLLLADPVVATAAEADRVKVDIPAGNLRDSLILLSRQTGVSVGMSGRLPDVSAPAIRGRMRPAEALERLLRKTRYRAVMAAPQLFRIEAAPAPAIADERKPVEAAPAVDIIVTGAKRPQERSLIPVSVAVVQLESGLPFAALPGSRDVAAEVDGLTLTNMGPGRNRQYIRGVADSPFSGTSQSTVAIQLDDARIGYDAPDPDLRLIDVERVEILKGPQGPLYGSGALGGVFHVVTRRPDLDVASAEGEIHGTMVHTGGTGAGGAAVLNLPLVTDRLALRIVGYRDLEPGWIDNLDGRRNSNETHVRGARVALRWRPADDWTVDLMAIDQRIDQDDSQYVTRSTESLQRSALFPEIGDNDFRLATMTISGRLGAIDIVSATSVTDQQIGTTLDASLSAGAFGMTSPLRYDEERRYSVVNQEIRLSQTREDSLSWVAGASWVQAESRFDGILTPTGGATRQVVNTHQDVIEFAAFGELSLPLADGWRLTGGGRLFRSIARDEHTSPATAISERQTRTGFTPSVSLGWTPARNQFWYVRVASALRPGGLSAAGTTSDDRFASDELTNVDFGWRLGAAGDRLSLEGAAYLTFWHHIQSDYLLANGLIGTHNVGNGRIYGLENRLSWKPSSSWTFEAGATVQSARLAKAFDPSVDAHGRLPVVPDVSLRLEAARRIEVAGWRGDARARLSYIGAAHLSFDSGLDRDMGQYVTAATALALSRDAWTISARVDNLFDAHGDSFGLGNPFSLRAGPQYTPLRPRTLTISATARW